MIGGNPSLSVSEFVAIFNQSLDMMFPAVAITGEIANFRVSKGKWVYFDLKDESSSVKFFGSVYALPGPLENGITVEVLGRPHLHNLYGFSVNYSSIRAVGEGSIRKAQELLLKKLEGEGLFALERKRSLPYPPQRIGLITSAESAAIADFKKIIAVRWPALKIELIDTLVQGAQAPAAIVKAIQTFNMESDPPEMLVIVRGGGSADDLAAFSEESVVRAVAASRLPTLVAIGHESDTSLAELAADRRASTPSNAAELLVPDMMSERLHIEQRTKTLADLLIQHFIAAQDYAQVYRETIESYVKVLFERTQSDLQNERVLLRALDPLLPLQQGYVLVRNDKGVHVKRAAQMKQNGVFTIEFTDGKKQIRLAKDE